MLSGEIVNFVSLISWSSVFIDPKFSSVFTFVLLSSTKHKLANTLVCFDEFVDFYFHCQQVGVFERYLRAHSLLNVVFYRKNYFGKKFMVHLPCSIFSTFQSANIIIAFPNASNGLKRSHYFFPTA